MTYHSQNLIQIFLKMSPLPPPPMFSIVFLFFVFLLSNIIFFKLRRRSSCKVYLLDYACFKPEKNQQITRQKGIELLERHMKNFDQDVIRFQRKFIMSCGIGDSTYAPESFLNDPPDFSMEGARREAEVAMYGVVDRLLAKTKVKVEDIKVLIVCGGLFSPIPSLTSMIVNRYKLRHDVKSFNLSGMGCCASIAAIGLAKHLLQVHKDTYAMVVSTEVTGQNVYKGKDIAKIFLNCLFRVGGAAVLLSNKPSDRHLSKYQLVHTVHTNTIGSDTSYGCIFQEEDSEGLVGITLNPYFLVEARKAILEHIETVARLVLPISALIRKPYASKSGHFIPDFRKGIDHFFPHVGGSSVINQVERSLKLDAEAPKMTLYRFGNTSSSSVWYELAYAEAKRRIKKGDRIWMIAYGSGFKCSSIVLRAMKNVGDQDETNPWFGEIDGFPVELNLDAIPQYFCS